jgi:hypothetical protein
MTDKTKDRQRSESAARSTTEDQQQAGLSAPVPLGVPLAGLAAAPVQRSAEGHPERDPLGDTQVDADIARTLSERRGRGQPLPKTVAEPMGQLLGTDLSSVRVHADADADRVSRSMQATAFTHGSDVYFTQGTYSPGTASGQRLLAHELAHVAQNAAGVRRSAASAPVIGRADDPAEAEADLIADRVLDSLRRRTADEVVPEAAHASGAPVDALRRQAARVDASVVRRGFKERVASIFNRGKSKGNGKDSETKASDTTTEQTPAPEYPKVVSLGKGGTEKVVLEKDGDLEEAEEIITELEQKYGIDISSPATIAGIKAGYSKVKKKEIAKLKISQWQMKELRGLRAAVANFAPILGPQRAKSTLAGKAQGVTTIGRVQDAIDENSKKGKVDRGTMGEYFEENHNVGLFDTTTNLVDSRYIREGSTAPDNATTIEANAIHEMAHGLIEPLELDNWVDELEFWDEDHEPSGTAGAEAPPTQYGIEGGPAEDLAESTAIFFTNRPKLHEACPKREAFLAKVVAAWTPAKAAEVVQATTEATGAKEPTPQPTADKQLETVA